MADEEQEKAYIDGSRMAWTRMLLNCLKELGVESPKGELARLIAEREMAVSALRRVCKDHGDNDWDEKLHLADIIEKHLGRYLED